MPTVCIVYFNAKQTSWVQKFCTFHKAHVVSHQLQSQILYIRTLKSLIKHTCLVHEHISYELNFDAQHV